MAPQDPRAALLAEPLGLVTEIARQVLGTPVSPNAALRWATTGRGGVRLLTVRGARRQRLTSLRAFREFWAQVSEAADGRRPATIDRAGADQVLEAMGLGRGK